MDDAGGVCRFQRHRHLDSHAQRLINFHGLAPHTTAECFALNELAGDVERRISLTNFENGDDVGMVQGEYST